MQTTLSDKARRLRDAEVAEAVLRSCVHCGFCNATCPTYQLLGNELDGPRGRIYLIKRMLETGEAHAGTRLHLDRCLTCRNCETTCPSGVRYGRLLDIGRLTVDQWAAPRPIAERAQRRLLRAALPNASLVGALVATATAARVLLPRRLADKLPRNRQAAAPRPVGRGTRQVLMLEGCVQPALSPSTNAAAARVLDRLGIGVVPAAQAGCCGAVDFHLDAQAEGLDRARRNIDAWWPAIEAGAEAIVLTASGCGAFVKEYGHLLRDDPVYAAKAARVSALARDLVEVLRDAPLENLGVRAAAKIAFHCPCTLQHAQKLGGAVEGVLTRLGFELTAVADSHLCCGSAGTYSLTQPALSQQLRDRKLDALERGGPQVIATANIGCQMHLDSARRTPVTHWIELVADAIGQSRFRATPPQEQNMQTKFVLTRDDVARIVAAARDEASRNGWPVSIAVVDDGGHPLALERLDGCAPIGAYIATEKARTSALGRRESKGYEDMINAGRNAFLSAPVLTGMLEGGVPIVVQGQFVGAVGVSGVKPDQDAQVARAGAAAVNAG